MTKFNRAYVLNPSPKFDENDLVGVADSVAYICPAPVYDAMSDRLNQFYDSVSTALDDFNNEKDVLVVFGDPIILSMAVANLSDGFDSINVARFSGHQKKYIIFNINLR